MPLSTTQAKSLLDTLNSEDFNRDLSSAEKTWSAEFSKNDFFDLSTENPLDTQLTLMRKMNLAKKSVVKQMDGKNIRIYVQSKKNITCAADDIFARGLDAARAANEILNNITADDSPSQIQAGLGAESPHKKNLVGLINQFHQNMQHHDKSQNLKNALKEIKQFHGALSSLLIEGGVVKNKEQAKQAINFVRDFLWKKDMANMPHCTLEGEPLSMIRYAEPVVFSADDVLDEVNPWKGDQPWKTRLFKKVGGTQEGSWIHHFWEKYETEIKQQSSTPMSRFTPNPANAYDCSDILVDDQEIAYISHHLRTAMTEPLSVGNTKSRQEVTNWNHKKLISETRLTAELNAFMVKWGDLYKDKHEIPFILLHQTLIGDEVTLTPDQRKAKASRFQASVINSKIEANQYLKGLLGQKDILRNKDSGEIRFVDKGHTEGGWQQINLHLLQTNNCINMWGSRARVRNHDIKDARRLIAYGNVHFQKLPEKYKNNQLNTVFQFLNSSDHSLFTANKFRGQKVKHDLFCLTTDLQNGNEPFGELSKPVRNTLAVALNAAVELKCMVHETWVGSLHRNISNFTRDYLRTPYLLGVGHAIDWVARSTMSALAFVGRCVQALFNPAQAVKHAQDRNKVFKSAYEGLLVESIGTLQGGCMSSADRAGEMAEQRVAMIKQLAQEGRLISYNDKQSEKERFYKAYGSTKAKHDFVEMGTGTQATSDLETRGFVARGCIMSYMAETLDEQKLAKAIHGLRKGEYDPDMTVEKYQSKEVAGSRPTVIQNGYGAKQQRQFEPVASNHTLHDIPAQNGDGDQKNPVNNKI